LLVSLAFASSAAQPVASMGSVVLSDVELKLALAEARMGKATRKNEIEALISTQLVRKALLAEASAAGWDRRPEVMREIERERERVMVTSYANHLARPPADYPRDNDIESFYAANRAQFIRPREYRLSQIFVPAGADSAARARAAEQARLLASDARLLGADFAALARSYSQHAQSAARGGDSGWIAEHDLSAALRAALAQLEPGATSDAIPSSQGWHIVKLVDSRPQGPFALEQVRDRIVALLRLRRAQETERAYIDRMLEKTPISIDEAALTSILSSDPF